MPNCSTCSPIGTIKRDWQDVLQFLGLSKPKPVRLVTGDRQIPFYRWSPAAPAMDVRPYRGVDGMDTHAKEIEGLNITYEDYEPGWDTSVGVARTSELQLWVLGATPSHQLFSDMAGQVATPARPVLTPQRLHACGVFGDWDNPYLTLNKDYQADIVKALGELVRDGYVYKEHTFLPNTTYTFSMWVKRVSGTGDMRLNVYDGHDERGASITPTTSWVRYSVTFTTGVCFTCFSNHARCSYTSRGSACVSANIATSIPLAGMSCATSQRSFTTGSRIVLRNGAHQSWRSQKGGGMSSSIRISDRPKPMRLFASL